MHIGGWTWLRLAVSEFCASSSLKCTIPRPRWEQFYAGIVEGVLIKENHQNGKHNHEEALSRPSKIDPSALLSRFGLMRTENKSTFDHSWRDFILSTDYNIRNAV